eukprot:6181459-Prorocentrum_lima.AAC.2
MRARTLTPRVAPRHMSLSFLALLFRAATTARCWRRDAIIRLPAGNPTWGCIPADLEPYAAAEHPPLPYRPAPSSDTFRASASLPRHSFIA